MENGQNGTTRTNKIGVCSECGAEVVLGDDGLKCEHKFPHEKDTIDLLVDDGVGYVGTGTRVRPRPTDEDMRFESCRHKARLITGD